MIDDLTTPTPATSTSPAPGRGGRSSRPLTVALVNDYEIILRGLHAMLAPFADRVRIVEREAGGTPDRVADIALFDTFAGRRDALDRARAMIAEGCVDQVVVYTWDAPAEFLEVARSIGVAGVVLKSVSGVDLVEVLERIDAGERPGLDHVARGARQAATAELSPREREVLALLALGLHNREIADELFVSVDTVKTYLQRLYRKLGVSNRTQAALCAADHAVAPPRRSGGGWEAVSTLDTVDGA